MAGLVQPKTATLRPKDAAAILGVEQPIEKSQLAPEASASTNSATWASGCEVGWGSGSGPGSGPSGGAYAIEASIKLTRLELPYLN